MALLAALGASLSIPATSAPVRADVPDQVRVNTIAPAPSTAPMAADRGTSLVLIEGSTGQVLVAVDAERPRPVASATKLITALAVIEAIPPRTLISIGDEVLGIGGSSYGLRPGDVRTIEDLLAGLLLRSGNDAALALAYAVDGDEVTFARRMAAVLRGLGIDAQPRSASGLDIEDALSAVELAAVSRAALAEPRIRTIVGRTELSRDEAPTIENRNRFVGQYPGATGLKTGYTQAAGYTLSASAERGGRELIAVVLGANDDLARRDAATALLEYGFSSTAIENIERSVTLRTGRGPVRFGTDGAVVTLRRGSEVSVAWPRTLRPDDRLDGVDVRIDGIAAGSASVSRRDGRRDGATAAAEDGTGAGIGVALADGLYAALRPFGLADGLR